MAIYAISDLHLAWSIDKPMDVFGSRWVNYMEKIRTNWAETVTDADVVIIPGDVSWSTYLEQAIEDFSFIEGLPGRKFISKGNHDYWWTTHSKLEKFLDSHGFASISFMHNNSYDLGNAVLCGTRGWKCPGDEEFDAEDRKIYNRELQRLELSLQSAVKAGKERPLLVAMHYPPVTADRKPTEFIEIMSRYGVEMCIYGHLHGDGCKNAFEGEIKGIGVRFVSADYLNFRPLLLYK